MHVRPEEVAVAVAALQIIEHPPKWMAFDKSNSSPFKIRRSYNKSYTVDSAFLYWNKYGGSVCAKSLKKKMWSRPCNRRYQDWRKEKDGMRMPSSAIILILNPTYRFDLWEASGDGKCREKRMSEVSMYSSIDVTLRKMHPIRREKTRAIRNALPQPHRIIYRIKQQQHRQRQSPSPRTALLWRSPLPSPTHFCSVLLLLPSPLTLEGVRQVDVPLHSLACWILILPLMKPLSPLP